MEEIKVGKVSVPIIKGEKGETGLQGIPGKDGLNGYSPVKGRDYFTDDEIQEIEEEVTRRSIENVEYNFKDNLKDIEYDNTTGILTFTRYDGTTKEVDLPLELIVSSGTYNDTTKELELTLANGQLIKIPLSDLIDDFYIKSEIDTKVDTINGELTNLKTEDSKLQETLTNQEKKIEELEEELETLYGDFEPNTVTGEVATINDGVNKSRVEVIGDGASYQETRDGYNLLDFRGFTVQANGSITCDIAENGELIINGTSGSNGTDIRISSTEPIVTLPVGSYIFDFKTTGDTSNKFNAEINLTWIGLGTYLLIKKIAENISYKQFSVTENFDIYNVNFHLAPDTTFTNYTLMPMIYSGTEIKPKEQYGSMPSTEFKSDIEVIDMVNKARLEKEGYYRQYSTGNFTVNADYNGYIADVKPNKTYTIKITTGVHSNIAFFDKDMKYLSGITQANTITTPDNCYFVTVAVHKDTIDFMIYEGTNDKPYLPYGHIGLLQKGKNIFNDTAEKKSGFPNVAMGNVLGFSNSSLTYSYVKCAYLQANIEYTISYKNDSIASNSARKGTITDENDIILEVHNTWVYDANSISITPKNSGWLTVPVDINAYDIQIEVGKQTEYEAPKRNLIPIDLQGNTLAKVGDIKDLLNIGLDGSVSITENNKLDIFDGSADENWTFDKNNNRAYISIIRTNANRTNSKCNMFKEGNTETNGNCFNVGTSSAFFRNDELISSSDDMRALLQEKPLQLLYTVEKAETIELPSIEPIKLFEGTNNFELITNLDTTLAVNYRISNNKRLKALESALVSLGGI